MKMSEIEENFEARVEAFRSGEDTTPIDLASAGFASGHLSYGDLRSMGYMSKSYVRGMSHEDMDIEWSLTQKAEGLVFKSRSDGEFSYPTHFETWEK